MKNRQDFKNKLQNILLVLDDILVESDLNAENEADIVSAYNLIDGVLSELNQFSRETVNSKLHE